METVVQDLLQEIIHLCGIVCVCVVELYHPALIKLLLRQEPGLGDFIVEPYGTLPMACFDDLFYLGLDCGVDDLVANLHPVEGGVIQHELLIPWLDGNHESLEEDAMDDAV